MKSEVKITDDRLQITRLFDAPRPLVFSCWAQAEKLKQWTACKDTAEVNVRMDFRVGGSFTQEMNIRGESLYSITGVYEEIVEPEKIVYSVNLGPATTRVTVEFFDQGERTKVVLTQVGFPDPSLVKIVSQGTSESFDKLDQLLGVLAA
jgi:uncharacterized protein YndB with AHSA1/START domain